MQRREFLMLSGAACATLALGRTWRAAAQSQPSGTLVNDVHSQLNETSVHGVERPTSLDALQALLRTARRDERCISIAGGRHAMGGQQFGTGALLLDMRGMDRVLRFDPECGHVEVEAGIQWPALIDHLVKRQADAAPQWAIRQKQTGADRLTLGGCVAANIHGRGLQLKPFIDDIESFTLIDADGEPRTCSRTENRELFALTIGGYGLFGVVATLTLRLTRRRKVQRVVEWLGADQLMPAFEQRIRDGFLYGDFQYSVAAGHDEYLREGVFSCYRPVDDATPLPAGQRDLKDDDWRRLYDLAHHDKKQGFDLYRRHYMATSGQVYWSDTHQLSAYVDDYHREVDRQRQASVRGSEMITEIYVPRESLTRFLATVRQDFEQQQTNLIYGTVRLIEPESESFLAWARRAWACVIFNLHVDHDDVGRARAAREFQRLIDRGIELGGSYYLTYHRWATRRQIETCYPQFAEFLKLKRKYDPAERFQSEWYRHYRKMFGE